MGSNRKLLSGVLLLVGAVVIFGLYRAVSSIGQNAATPTPPPVQVSQARRRAVARATVEIPQGSIVTKDMIEMWNLPGDAPSTAGFVTDPETQAYGYITSVPIPKGAQLRPSEDFVGHITEVGIAGMLRPNYRAVVIPLANMPTLHDLVRVGNYVDINASYDSVESNTVVENVRVLAVDVYGSNFPVVNIGMSGRFKADPKPGTGPSVAPGSVTASGAPADPNATPTAAPTTAPAPPDPAITVEVTTQQAKALLLAKSSGAALDYALRPARPGGGEGVPTTPGEETTSVRPVAVLRSQLAPIAESRKNSKESSSKTTKVDMGLPQFGKSLEKIYGTGGGGSQAPKDWPNPGSPVQPNPGTGVTGVTPVNPETLTAPTYDIPIYADGKTVRVETVRSPQE